MKRYKIFHQTNYLFANPVQLLPHTLRLRPRESHDLRIEKSSLDITPDATLRWHRDVEGNSVATASFIRNTRYLRIDSEVIIQQYAQAPYDFLVADYAVDYPFQYTLEDQIQLSPYLLQAKLFDETSLNKLLAGVWQPGEIIQSFALLMRLNQVIHQSLQYRIREEPGVQSPAESLACGSGSCRDSAYLFMSAAQKLGFATRFVTGYVNSNSLTSESGSTHAWAEIFIPGAGWKGFDPTANSLVGVDHIAVAVARLPESVPPVSGSFLGAPGAEMTVSVWVTALS